MSILRAEQLTKSYGARKVVQSLSLDFHQGEVLGLLGANGAGKTTSFYMILGMVKPDSGKVFLDQTDLTLMPVYQRARLGVGYLPQESSVFRSMTVEENISMIPQTLGFERRQVQSTTEQLLADFGLESLRCTKGYALSGGERRRVEIARALALKPKFLLLDEPFSGVDPIAVCDIQAMILRLRDQGYGILITDHNVRDTLAITDRAHLIHQGQILLTGTAQQIAESEVARKYYLGERFAL